MSRLVSGALAIVAIALLSGCVSVTGPSAPTAAPTQAGPGPTPAGPVQTNAPLQTPGEQPSGNICHIVTLDELSAAAGGTRAVLGEDYDQEGQCNWDVGELNEIGVPDAFVNLRGDFGIALEEARTTWPGGEELEIGEDAYWAPDINVLYFKKGGRVYAVQVVNGIADEEIDFRDLAIGVATVAASRL